MPRVKVASLALAACLMGPVDALAQEEGITLMIDQITCREMLKMENEARDFTIVFLHGFISGKASIIEFDGPKLTAATEAILDSCIGSPDDSLLSVFERVRSG